MINIWGELYVKQKYIIYRIVNCGLDLLYVSMRVSRVEGVGEEIWLKRMSVR